MSANDSANRALRRAYDRGRITRSVTHDSAGNRWLRANIEAAEQGRPAADATEPVPAGPGSADAGAGSAGPPPELSETTQMNALIRESRSGQVRDGSGRFAGEG